MLIKKLTQSFNLTEEELKLVFILPYKIVYEPYVKAFQYKILNLILYTNKKLFKIGDSEHDRCTSCDNGLETLDHLFFYCCFSNIFWTHFEKYYFTLTKKSRVLSNQDIILGFITSPCPLLNYLILMVSYICGIAEESAYTHTLRVLNKKLKLIIKQSSILPRKIMIY